MPMSDNIDMVSSICSEETSSEGSTALSSSYVTYPRAFAVLMNFLTAASDKSSSGLSFSGASTCCVLCSSALAAFAITSLQAAPGLPLGHQGRDRHTQLWLPFLPCVLRYLVTHELSLGFSETGRPFLLAQPELSLARLQ